MGNRMKGNLMLLVTAFIWGSTFVAQSAGMEHIGPFAFSAARDVLAMVVLIPIILIFSSQARNTKGSILKKLNPDSVTLKGGAVCGLVLGVADTLQQTGLCMTTAGKSGFITALYIIIVPLMGYFSGKKVERIIAFSVMLAIIGFYFLCIKDGFDIGLGDFLTLGCAFFYALHIVVIDKYLLLSADSIKMSWVQFFFAFFFSGTLTLLFEELTVQSLWDARYTIMYAGIMSSTVAYTLQIVGQKYTEPTTATLIMSLESVFAALSGWAILGEKMLPREFLGCVLVFAAVILAQLPMASIMAAFKSKSLSKRT